MKFLDLTTGLPKLWQHILARIETHNTSTTSHSDMRTSLSTLTTSVENKVDKDGTKQLSSNDFTDALKTKLEGMALGETSSTAYRGDRGKIAYDHAQAKGTEVSIKNLYEFKTNAEGHITEASAVDSISLPYSTTFGFRIASGSTAGQWGYRLDANGLRVQFGQDINQIIKYDATNTKSSIPLWSSTGSSSTPVYFNASGYPVACEGSLLTTEQVSTLTSIRAMTEAEINAIFDTEIIPASEVSF